MLYAKDTDYYMDYLQEQDEVMCRKIHGRKPSLFYNIGFITFNNTNNPPNVIQQHQGVLEGRTYLI
jgi:hypothetical protein